MLLISIRFRNSFRAFLSAVDDGVLELKERDDLRWLCKRLKGTDFYDMVTADLQRFHALVGALLLGAPFRGAKFGAFQIGWQSMNI